MEDVTIRVRGRLLEILCATPDTVHEAIDILSFYCDMDKMVNERGYAFTQVRLTFYLEAPDPAAMLLEIESGRRNIDDVPNLDINPAITMIECAEEVRHSFENAGRHRVCFFVE